MIRPIDNEDTMEIVERLRIVTLGCEVCKRHYYFDRPGYFESEQNMLY